MTVTQFKSYTSNAPTWLTSPFFRAGQEEVISTFTGSSQYPFRSYTFTYSSALPGVPNLAYGIQKYRGTSLTTQETTTSARNSTKYDRPGEQPPLFQSRFRYSG